MAHHRSPALPEISIHHGSHYSGQRSSRQSHLIWPLPFRKKFKVQKYLTFGPDTQCSKCLAFGHHTTRCANPTHCTFCAGDHPAYLHTCGRSDCPTKGKPCLHTTLKCSNCGDNHQADSEECQTYQDAHQEATERRNRAD